MREPHLLHPSAISSAADCCFVEKSASGSYSRSASRAHSEKSQTSTHIIHVHFLDFIKITCLTDYGFNNLVIPNFIFDFRLVHVHDGDDGEIEYVRSIDCRRPKWTVLNNIKENSNNEIIWRTQQFSNIDNRDSKPFAFHGNLWPKIKILSVLVQSCTFDR